VELNTSLKDRLVGSSTTGNDSDGSSARSGNGLSSSRGESDSGLITIFRVTNNGSVAARCSRESTSVSDFLFDVANDGTFGDFVNG